MCGSVLGIARDRLPVGHFRRAPILTQTGYIARKYMVFRLIRSELHSPVGQRCSALRLCRIGTHNG